GAVGGAEGVAEEVGGGPWRPATKPPAASQVKSLMWRRRALSRRVRTSTRNNALGAGTIVAPGAWAWLTRGSKCTRANKGRQRPPPPAPGRPRRPGGRVNARAAATTVGSGTAGVRAGGGL